MVLFLKPHREAITVFYILSYIFFPKWERQGKIKGARERKESRNRTWNRTLKDRRRLNKQTNKKNEFLSF